MDTAKFWGLSPWTFDALDSEEKAEMIAFRNATQIVESYHYEMSEQCAKSEDTLLARNARS